MYILAKLLSRLTYSWSDQTCLPLMFGCTCLQKVDSIVQARQQVYANFHMREDRLVAINILATHWRNQRKTFVKKTKELAVVETGKKMVEPLLLVANACPSLLQQLPLIINDATMHCCCCLQQQEHCLCRVIRSHLGVFSPSPHALCMHSYVQAAKVLMKAIMRQMKARRSAVMRITECIVVRLGQHDPWLSLVVLQDKLVYCHGHEATLHLSGKMMELVIWRLCSYPYRRCVSGHLLLSNQPCSWWIVYVRVHASYEGSIANCSNVSVLPIVICVLIQKQNMFTSSWGVDCSTSACNYLVVCCGIISNRMVLQQAVF